MSESIFLGEHIDVTSGFPFDSKKFNSERKGFPLIRIRDISSSDTEVYFDGQAPKGYEVLPGDILIGMDGSFNISKWAGGPALLNQRVLRLREKPNRVLHLPFVTYFLIDRLKALEDSTGQTTVKHLIDPAS